MSTFLQSDAWARFQQDLGHEVFRSSGPGYSFLATLEGGRLGRYLYCPYGPEAESPEALTAALAELKDLARAHRCLFVRVEPTDPRSFPEGADPAADLERRGLHFSPRQIQPSHTWMVDLTQDEDTILKSMGSTNRNLHRNIHKKGVSFVASSDPADVAHLARFLDQTAQRVGFNRQKDDYLMQLGASLLPQGDATLYLVMLEGRPIGASLAYDSEDTRTYAHASMDGEHRRLRANNPMVTRMILDAKAKGLSRFDMFGIAPDDQPDHEWAGFTQFKKSYGGYAVTYPGTWDLPVHELAYRAFTGVYAAKEKAVPALRQAREKTVPAVRERLAALRSRGRRRTGD